MALVKQGVVFTVTTILSSPELAVFFVVCGQKKIRVVFTVVPFSVMLNILSHRNNNCTAFPRA